MASFDLSFIAGGKPALVCDERFCDCHECLRSVYAFASSEGNCVAGVIVCAFKDRRYCVVEVGKVRLAMRRELIPVSAVPSIGHRLLVRLALDSRFGLVVVAASSARSKAVHDLRCAGCVCGRVPGHVEPEVEERESTDCLILFGEAGTGKTTRAVAELKNKPTALVLPASMRGAALPGRGAAKWPAANGAVQAGAPADTPVFWSDSLAGQNLGKMVLIDEGARIPLSVVTGSILPRVARGAKVVMTYDCMQGAVNSSPKAVLKWLGASWRHETLTTKYRNGVPVTPRYNPLSDVCSGEPYTTPQCGEYVEGRRNQLWDTDLEPVVGTLRRQALCGKVDAEKVKNCFHEITIGFRADAPKFVVPYQKDLAFLETSSPVAVDSARPGTWAPGSDFEQLPGEPAGMADGLKKLYSRFGI